MLPRATMGRLQLQCANALFLERKPTFWIMYRKKITRKGNHMYNGAVSMLRRSPQLQDEVGLTPFFLCFEQDDVSCWYIQKCFNWNHNKQLFLLNFLCIYRTVFQICTALGLQQCTRRCCTSGDFGLFVTSLLHAQYNLAKIHYCCTPAQKVSDWFIVD